MLFLTILLTPDIPEPAYELLFYNTFSKSGNTDTFEKHHNFATTPYFRCLTSRHTVQEVVCLLERRVIFNTFNTFCCPKNFAISCQKSIIFSQLSDSVNKKLENHPFVKTITVRRTQISSYNLQVLAKVPPSNLVCYLLG